MTAAILALRVFRSAMLERTMRVGGGSGRQRCGERNQAYYGSGGRSALASSKPPVGEHVPYTPDATKRFHIDCELDYAVAQRTLFVFNLAIAATPTQRIVAETVSTSSDAVVDEFNDEAGRNRFFRADVAPGQFSIRYLATVEVQAAAADTFAPEIPLARMPGANLAYLQSSRYCQVEAIFSFACRKFANWPAGYRRVLAICQWVKENLDYQEGSSALTSGAHEILANRAGVCRAFAHVSIAFCRALNIPARFVTAYTKYQEPPQDFHAVMEAFLGDRWYLFDPTGLAEVSDLVRIGTGRDASEVAFATFFGAARLRRLSPLVERASGAETLVGLQTADAGILRAPFEGRGGQGI